MFKMWINIKTSLSRWYKFCLHPYKFPVASQNHIITRVSGETSALFFYEEVVVIPWETHAKEVAGVIPAASHSVFLSQITRVIFNPITTNWFWSLKFSKIGWCTTIFFKPTDKNTRICPRSVKGTWNDCISSNESVCGLN